MSDALDGFNFSVEMETGTGKTYVYLRTLFELNKMYGFTKFVIVVPSIAIREGVLASIDLLRDHLRSLYDNVPFDASVYDSKHLGRVRQFATSNTIQLLVMNIQAFQKDVEEDRGPHQGEHHQPRAGPHVWPAAHRVHPGDSPRRGDR